MINPRRITNNQSSNIKQFSNDLKNPKSLLIDYWLLIITKRACLVLGYCLLIIGIWNLVITLNVPKVNAESLSVSLRVGDTRVQFSGFTSPGTFITIKQNGVVVSTTVADANGDFDQTIDAYNPGLQSFDLSSTDTLGHSNPALSYNINAISNTLTTIGNIVFPPSIVLDPVAGTLSGLSHPLSSITLMLSTSVTYPISVAPSGTWSFDLNTLPVGDYTVYAIASMPGNIISLESRTISFSIAGLASSAPSATPALHIERQSAREMPGDAEQSGRPRRIITGAPEHQITATPTPSLSPSPLSTLFITIAKPVSVLSVAAPLALIVFISKSLFFKKKKKKN